MPPRFFPQFGICALLVLQRLLSRLHAAHFVTYRVPRIPCQTPVGEHMFHAQSTVWFESTQPEPIKHATRQSDWG